MFDRWELRSIFIQNGVSEDVETLYALLADGWEPFAATTNPGHGHYYHFRRKLVDRDEIVRNLSGK